VIQQQATAGIIIASSILTARALAPVDLVIANWKNFSAARFSWDRLKTNLEQVPQKAEPMDLPEPSSCLSVRSVFAVPPDMSRPVVHDVSFELRAGQALGVIGPSASGKSSLARVLVGVWPPARGRVQLDGAALDQWEAHILGRHIGYLPQDVELFVGSVAENIARFYADAGATAVVAAAKAAGVHEMILELPQGYQTELGERGVALSAGQRQRIALARALYGDPFLLVFDEPNSNLDHEGERALVQAIEGVKARGGIVIIIAHRPSVLAAVNLVLVISDGRAVAFGERNEILKRMRPQPVTPQSAVPRATATASIGSLKSLADKSGAEG